MNISIDENIISLLISISALLISLIAMYFTIRAFLLKAGQKFRCDISVCSTIECDDKYISSITIENLKDRAAVIFKIFAKYGLNNYLLIEDFSNSPLILKPFEVYYKEYDPILFYSLGTEIGKLDKIFDNKKVKSRILLATTNGKYKIKSNTKRWDPIITFFKNHYTAIINPIRLKVKDKFYGNNIKYIVVLNYDNDKEQVIPINQDEHRHVRFAKFQLTKENLKSKNALELFFKKQNKEGKITFDKIEIIDFRDEVEKIRSKYTKDPIYVESYNFFNYRILGKILTIRDIYKMKMRNKKNRKKLKQKLGQKEKKE